MSQNNESNSNRLINETSPYLIQHAYNPVDWYPWGEEALERARNEQRLILLSIGYSACHWCHVMERESFENEQIAEIMNKHYVCIKVDREERPDLDKIYQVAHQMFNQRGGGWPLTAFLTYDEHAPVFVGTYFPDKSRHGMPSFATVLENIAQQFSASKDRLSEHNRVIKEAFERFSIPEPNNQEAFDESLLDSAVESLIEDYDPVYGGFGYAPKFPHPTQIEVLSEFCQRQNSDPTRHESVMNIILHTLDAMGNGGLYDQVGGGFYRYAVDAKWEIPHFEKMLYDNAQLIPHYVGLGIVTDRTRLSQIAQESAQWVIREMQAPQGGYFSTLDADSEGEEGKFYVWKSDELREVLDEQEYRVVDIRFGLRGRPNFEGNWHLTAVNSIIVVAQRSGIPIDQTRQLLESACAKLFDVRCQRIWPGRDDKILASWNGLMIKAMARTGRLLNQVEFIESAQRALDFVRTHMWKNGRLHAAAMGEQARFNGYLDDYAFVADAVIEMLQVRWRNEDLDFVIELVDALVEHFTDVKSQAFYFTSDDHEKLIHRSIPTNDDATPSGNGIAAQVLTKLGYLTGDTQYLDKASGVVQGVSRTVTAMPSAFGSVLVAIEQIINPPPVVIIRGDLEEMAAWARAVMSAEPLKPMVFQIPRDVHDGLPVMLAEKKCGDSTTAYVCTGFTCSAPCSSLDQLLRVIADRKSSSNS